jgi:AcrR family transcriptional regulator
MPRAFTGTERQVIRERLLQAGREALPRTGFRRTSVGSLTRAAGISKGAFYGFFDSKEALFVELLREAEGELRGRLQALVDDEGQSPASRLRGVVELLFAALSDHPILVALTDPEELAWLERALPPGALAAAQEDDDRWFGALWEQLVQIGAGDPEVDPTDFAALAPAALALAVGWRALHDPRAARASRWLVDAAVHRLAR